MSREVNVHTKGGGGSIGLVPGVVPAAWGGPGRARGAVRAVPKTEDFAYSSSRVKGLLVAPFRHSKSAGTWVCAPNGGP